MSEGVFGTDENLFGIASFLGIRGLAALEQVCVLNQPIIAHIWEGAASAALEEFPVWGPIATRFLEQLKKECTSSKERANACNLLRRRLFPPKAWKPWITDLSFCSFQVTPYSGADLESSSYGDSEIQRLPYPAAIPISLGVCWGQPLVVGMKIIPEGNLDDNICVGVELRNEERSACLMFAPFAGHLFNELTSDGPIMKAAPLKPLEVAPAVLSVFVQIFDNGAVRFLRQVEDQAPEDIGYLPSESFPPWVEEFFPCIYVYGETLAAAATVSVNHAGHTFPVGFADKPATEMEAVWSLIDPEMW